MGQTFETLNACENVTAVDASGLFYNWDEFYDTYYRKPEAGTVNVNHIFSFEKNRNEKQCIMTTKEAANSDVQNQQNLFFQKRNMTLVHRKLSLLHGKPRLIKGPGLNPIKQVDLFTKWRAIVPFEFKDEICRTKRRG